MVSVLLVVESTNKKKARIHRYTMVFEIELHCRSIHPEKSKYTYQKYPNILNAIQLDTIHYLHTHILL